MVLLAPEALDEKVLGRLLIMVMEVEVAAEEDAEVDVDDGATDEETAVEIRV